MASARRARSTLLLGLLLGVNADAPYPTVADKGLDCAVRQAAFDFAQAIQPNGPAAAPAVFDALQLGSYCGFNASGPASLAKDVNVPAVPRGPIYYADALLGNDSNTGSEASPFRTIDHGVAACRVGRTGIRPTTTGACTLILRDSAPFILDATVSLGPADSGIAIAALPNEHPVVSGAAPLPLSTQWMPWKQGGGSNVWSARVSLPVVPGSLFVEGARMVRARWPNANPETDLIPAGYSNATSWLPPSPASPPVPVELPQLSRPWDHYFPNWTWAVNGTAEGCVMPHPRFAVDVYNFALPQGF